MVQTAEQISGKPSALTVKLAGSQEEIEQALRLRYQVFVQEEKNMKLRNDTGLESDAYDPYCDHLIVKDENSGEVIGTYRLLPGDRALAHIGFYSETEFDLSGFARYKPKALELGRSCIAEPYRSGKAIQLLWEGIARYIADRHYEYLIGCASVHLHNLPELNEIYSLLCMKHVITDRYAVKPLNTHKIVGLQRLERLENEKEIFRRLPPLMKGYQWLGAEIAGEPAYDAVFNTVDFFIVLDTTRVTRKYKNHFLKHQSGGDLHCTT